MLRVNRTMENGIVCLAPEGRLDTMTAPEFDREIKEVVPQARELTLDFEKLEYISSAGLRALLYAQKAMGKQGQMKVIHVNEYVMEILDVTGFSNILTIE